MIPYTTSVLITLLAIGSLALPTQSAALDKINVSYGAISGSMAQTWVAKEAKLFEKHGLDVNLVYISGGPRSIMSLIGGSVQYVNHSGMPALEAYQRGADTALLATPVLPAGAPILLAALGALAGWAWALRRGGTPA